MPLLTTSVPNLSQGVSQQPDNLRYPGQGESQINAYSSVVDGLVKRPSTRYVGTLESSSISADSLVHVINHDSDNRHVLVITPSSNTAKVYNTTDGSTVSTLSNSYVNVAKPRESLKALTIANTTYILNKTTTTAMDTSQTSNALVKEAIVFVKQGDYSKEYTVTIDGADKTYTTGDGSSSNSDSLHASAGDGTDASSETIAAGLVSAIGTISGITVVRNGSVIKLTSTNSTFTVSVRDGLSNIGLGMAYQEVSAITDLPKSCYQGFTVKVKGDVELVQDDYYVKFVVKEGDSVAAGTFGEGSWEETIGPEVQTTIDNTTMPVKLVPAIGFGSYTLNTTTWTNRLVGDADTNPDPSFIGNPISDIFFYKNRLGFLSGQNVIFSEADSYDNFFRTTVLTLLDSAPIDVGVSHTKVSLLKHAIPFQEKLVLFSPQSQFVLRGTDLLTPKTINISPITEYNVTENAQPLALGNFIYFPFERGGFQGVYEFYVDSTTDVFDASEITSHVPKYIPTELKEIRGTPSEDVMVATTTGNTKHLYVYKYFWQGKEKVQSSWSRFEFKNDVIGTGFVNSDLFMVTTDGTNTYLESMPMEAGVTDTGKDYTILLDSRVNGSALSRTYDSATKLTTIDNIPFDPVNAVVYTASGQRIVVSRVDANTGTVPVDVSDGAFFIGFEYNMEYQFSAQTLKQPTERGGKSSSNFTHQTLRNGAIDYADTGHFTVEVTPLYRDTYNYVYNPTHLGADSVIGSLVLDSGSFRFPIHAKHDEATIKIKSSSALPAQILAAEFESFITPRSQRYGG
jgi:hypothetical protein